MRKGRLDNDLVGIAGVHYVAFELSRRGLVVLPTTRNTRGYDMVAIRRDGSSQANIQVKAAQKRPGFFPMPKSPNVRCGRNDYYVLVRGIRQGNEPECFLVKGGEARIRVRRHEREARRRGAKPFPCIYVQGKNVSSGLGEGWKRAWETWEL